MRRRSFVAGLGAVAAGGAVIGSGAFTSTEADRDVTVSVANEDEAFLRLEDSDGPNSGFANQGDDDEIFFDINDVVPGDGDGEGPGTNSVYTIDNVFVVENQGTQEREFTVEFEGIDDLKSFHFYVGDNDGEPLSDNPEPIGAGEDREIGIKLDTDGIDIGSDGELEDEFDAVIEAIDSN